MNEVNLIWEYQLSNTKIHNKKTRKIWGNVAYADYQSLENDFCDKKVHPGDLKSSITQSINSILEPIRKKLENDPELKELVKNAYPEPAAKIVVNKKSKSNSNINDNSKVSTTNINN